MNYYEQPVAQTFIDTYAPLPFQEMAMLGSAYKREKDETEARIDEFKAKYGDFTSISQADTNAWDAETMGKLSPSLMQMASDPEKIKSQEFQAGIRNAIRSVDTAKLGALRQSAENLKQRAAVIAQLQAQGKYKKSWDNIDIATWDTSKQGIMTDLAPLEYQTLHDIAAPYTQALKDQYLGKIDRYRYWVGVDEKQIKQSLSTSATDIFNTPQGQAWYKDISSELATKGITDPNVVREEVMNRLVQSQKDYMRKNIAYDTAAIQEDEMAMKRSIAAAKTKVPPTQPARYTDMIRLDGKRYLNSIISSSPSVSSTADKEALSKASMDLQIANLKGNQSEIARAQAAYDNIANNANRKDLDTTIRNNFEYAIGRELTGNKSVNYADLVKGTKSVVDLLSSDNDLAGAQQILRNASNAVPKQNSELEFVLSDSRQLQNPTTVVSSLGSLGLRKHSNDFDKLLSSGAFRNLTVSPVTTKGLFNYTDKNGNLKQKQRVIVTLKDSDIDLNEVRGSSIASDRRKLYGLLTANGARITNLEPGKTSSTSSYDVSSDGDTQEKKRSITNTRGNDRYITFEAFIDVPEDQSGYQGTTVSSINSGYNRAQMTAKDASGLYPQEQADAFYGQGNISLDNILEE